MKKQESKILSKDSLIKIDSGLHIKKLGSLSSLIKLDSIVEKRKFEVLFFVQWSLLILLIYKIQLITYRTIDGF